MKKLLFLSFLFTLGVFAIPKSPCDVQEVCCQDPAPGPFAFTYPKDIGLSCPRDFYGYADFLWMKGIEEGLDYAIEQDQTDSTIHFPLDIGDVKGFSTRSQEWDFRPGFRVGFGFYSNHDAWNFDLAWTYIRIKANSLVDNGSTGELLPILVSPINTIVDLPLASARWSGDYNTFDLMIGKPFHVSRYFISNPAFGLRAAWIDQDFHVRYFINELKRNVYLKNDFWGVGLRGAYEGNFLLGSGWYLYGKAAMSLLFGKFDISQHADIGEIGQGMGAQTPDHKTENSFYDVIPNTEVAMGIQFSKYFHKNEYQVGLKVGYEFHEFWSINQLRKFYHLNPAATDVVSRGDLTFNGLTFGLHVEF